MNNNKKPSLLRGKGAAVGIVICFVAVIGLVGAYTFSNYRKDMKEQIAKATEQGEELTEEMENSSEETTADEILLPEEEDRISGGNGGENGTSGDAGTGSGTGGAEGADSAGGADGSADDASGGTASGQSGDTASDGTVLSGADTSGLWFGEGSTLAWPASGAVILGYSMDQTVFFQTLDQYKYNPAMIIAGETGETIAASAAGVVANIEETAQTGTTVTLDMGNGYSAVYGQLTEIPVAVGDYVAAGEPVGILNEPTKYYSVEGPNLYFEVVKDGEAVDPMQFME